MACERGHAASPAGGENAAAGASAPAGAHRCSTSRQACGGPAALHTLPAAPVRQEQVDAAHILAVGQAPQRLARHVQAVQLQVVAGGLQRDEWRRASTASRAAGPNCCGCGVGATALVINSSGLNPQLWRRRRQQCSSGRRPSGAHRHGEHALLGAPVRPQVGPLLRQRFGAAVQLPQLHAVLPARPDLHVGTSSRRGVHHAGAGSKAAPISSTGGQQAAAAPVAPAAVLHSARASRQPPSTSG